LDVVAVHVVTNRASSRPEWVPASASLSTVARPASTCAATCPARTSVPAPARPGMGPGIPVPAKITSASCLPHQ
jgi:hypothetical protein